MKRAISLLLLTTACGSDAFLSFPPDAAEAGSSEAGNSEAGDAITADSNPLTDGGPCTPPGTSTWKCESVNVMAPAEFCAFGDRYPMPTACTTCKENYSCGCLEEHGGGGIKCLGDAGTWHCDDKNGQLLVTCQ
jgi:hypothetical protein